MERAGESQSLTLAFDVVLLEVALVHVAIGPDEHAFTLLRAIHVDAFELGAVGPPFDSLPVLHIVLPEAPVQTAVGVHVVAEAVGLVVEPFTLVYVAVLVDQPAEV